MKDLTIEIEEKAKRYDEAIERAKIKRDEYIRLDGPKSYVPQDIEFIFPELAESEDEMIRKHIIEILSSLSPCHFDGNEKSECIAWLEKQKTTEEALQYLKENHSPSEMSDFQSAMNIAVAKAYNKGYADGLEKQGEQKPVDKVEPKFKVGDWIINSKGKIRHIIGIDESGYLTDYGWLTHDSYEREFHLWTIQDAKDGDVLVASDNSIFLFKCVDDYSCKHYVALTTANVLVFNEGLENYWEISRAVHPATKEQCDLLFQKMKEAGYEWNTEDKALRKIEQKPAWSEEDEERFVSCLQRLGTGNLEQPETINTIWLKSLKERVQLV